MKDRISVSELLDWQRCRLLWYYKYARRLQTKPDDNKTTPQRSGQAIHFGIESGMLAPTGADKLSTALSAARLYLEEYGAYDSGRFWNGVESGIRGVPVDFWEAERPQVEDTLTVTYDISGSPVTVVGRPDHWLYSNDAIVITDYKSTSKDEAGLLTKLEIWNMQVRYYAVLIHDWLVSLNKHVPPVYTRHMILSTRGKHAYGCPKLLSPSDMNFSRKSMQDTAEAIMRGSTGDLSDGSYMMSCEWCDFGPIDIVGLTGGNRESIIEAEYQERKHT